MFEYFGVACFFLCLSVLVSMSAVVSPQKRGGDPHYDLLDSFSKVLASSEQITIPRDTLCGALTHFLSGLPSAQLSTFVSTLARSPSLWRDKTNNIHHSNQGYQLHDSGANLIREAIRLSVSTKIDSIDQELGQGYIGSWKRQKRARQWLRSILSAIPKNGSSEARDCLHTGIIQGLDDISDLDWGSDRVKLEQAIILHLADRYGAGHMSLGKETLESFVAVMPHIAAERLSALDLRATLPQLQSELLRGLDREGYAASFARAIARCFTVLDQGGPSSRRHAWVGMREFCVAMRTARNRATTGADAATPEWENGKTALFSFLLPAQAILDILLSDDPPSTRSTASSFHPSANLAIEILHTLFSFATIADSTSGGLDGYERLLYGSLDVLVARGGQVGINGLFKRLRGEPIVEAEDAFLLHIGEQLVHSIDAPTLRYLLEVAERRVIDPIHAASFAAAHAFVLAVLKASADSTTMTTNQRALSGELLTFYSSLIFKQARQGDITSDQLGAAFSVLLAVASDISPHHLQALFHLLDAESLRLDDHAGYATTLLFLRISSAAYVPLPGLRLYLDDLARGILQRVESGGASLDVAGAAFKMVIEDLPDESREVGMGWWMDWRDAFEGKEVVHLKSPKARL
ncbi:hypothetical protein BCR39DRAFT_515796 [Naematelia encephala]|uniref:Uncharacterized protein n=1 Tax=Naematelia encephala TaxID=71784 RepID=A0A1Y2BJK9_9TREE|nr:hypothetical protein BCR39DRAFT_515796 [Naematelia encephala]